MVVTRTTQKYARIYAVKKCPLTSGHVTVYLAFKRIPVPLFGNKS